MKPGAMKPSTMNPRLYAARLGARRGWTEFTQSLRSTQDQTYNLVMAGTMVAVLFLLRDESVEGTGLSYATFTLPGMLGGLMVFGLAVGPATAIALEREDGTVLRLRAAPHGMTGYVVSQTVTHGLGVVPTWGLILVPSLLLFDGVVAGGAAGLLTVAWVLPLGILAVLPIGIVLGSVMPSAQKAAVWSMLPVMGLAMISGVFFPMADTWGWTQVLAQFFPMYWLGLGMRSAFLPEAAAAAEIGESWRQLETALVLGAWTVAGLALAPVVLRRMARRQSGSHVAAARATAGQVVR